MKFTRAVKMPTTRPCFLGILVFCIMQVASFFGTLPSPVASLLRIVTTRHLNSEHGLAPRQIFFAPQTECSREADSRFLSKTKFTLNTLAEAELSRTI